jgi:hypothetical protein
MVVNFKTCRINQNTHKLIRTPTLIKKIIQILIMQEKGTNLQNNN